MAGEFNSETGAKARRQKGARHAHASIKAQGRVPGAEARPARVENARRRRLIKLLDSMPVYESGAMPDPHGASEHVTVWDGE